MEHTILDTTGAKLYISKCGEIDQLHNLNGIHAGATLTPEAQLKLVKALLPKILERGDLDASIKTWIEHNKLDGDPLDGNESHTSYMNPTDMYGLVYDCVNDIMEN